MVFPFSSVAGVLRVLLAALAMMIAALAPAAAEEARTEIALKFDPSDGAVSYTVDITAPDGPVRLPALDWLSVDAVHVDGRPVRADAAVGAQQHAGRTVRVSLSGSLPATPGTDTAAAFHPDASYMIGDAWLPRDARPRRSFTTHVTLDASQRAASGGAKLSDRVEDGVRRVRFAFTGRGSDLTLFFGPYTETVRQRADLTLRTYFEADDSALSNGYLDNAADYIARYAALIGPYPYEEFSVVSATLPVGLGFAGATYVSRDILGHSYMQGRSLAHEVLHAWWGNAVVADFDTGNWAEGLTTYMADYALAEEADAEAARRMRVGWMRALAEIPTDEAQALVAFKSSFHSGGQQGEGYGKAAMVFHMLRNRIGDAAFDAGLAAFYADHRGGEAAWSDLRAAFEAASGADLAAFFDAWTTRAGLPELALETARRADDGAIALSLRQSAPPYDLRVPVVFDTDAGPVRRTLALRTASATYRVAVPGTVRAVHVDPDFDLARMPAEGELAPILSALRGPGPVRAVMLAEDTALADALRSALAPLLPEQARWQDAGADVPDAAGLLVAGPAEAVAALRDRLIPDPAVMPPDTGTARVWVERRPGGAPVVFAVSDDADTLAQDLRHLPFYLGQSFVVAAEGRTLAAGLWPDPGGALRAVLP